MPVELLLNSCRNRVPWPTMRAILNMCKLPRARGWDDLIRKLVDGNNETTELSNNLELLKKLYCNHLLIGEKAIKFFDVERETIDKLIAIFEDYRIERTVFHEAYPFLLSEEQLKEHDSLSRLVEIRDSNENLAIIFSTKRSSTKRIEIDLAQLSVEAKRDLRDYDELIGIKKQTRQSFDAVVLWKEKEIIEVRIDITNENASEERSIAFFQTITQFNNLVKEKINLETVLENNINFFPLIDRLYNSNEGRVCELGFSTDEGSIKLEKMRKNELDLRNETYHRAGRDAVNHITPYRLAIIWKCFTSDGIETQPELLLPGQAGILSNSTQHLGEATVSKCSSIEDYNFILEKINLYLNNCG